MSEFVMPFSKIGKEDVALVGGKGANLGEMWGAGFPVPNGFCITAEAYRQMLKHNNFEEKIKDILGDLDVENSRKLQDASNKVMKMLSRADIPREMAMEIIKAYLALKPGTKHPFVAVRSSATAEDLPEASFAGQQATFLNISGEANLMQAVRDAWASLFEARAIFYRVQQGFDHFKVALAIPVQLMVQSHVSGIMFTINPVTNDKRIVVIEAVWGLGELIVQGSVTPDHYEVHKDTMRIYSTALNSQKVMMTRVSGGKTKIIGVPKSLEDERKLSDEQVLKLAELAMKLQQHYMFPQDSEWAEEDGKLYIVQTRPITTMKAAGEAAARAKKLTVHGMKLLLSGDSASPGVASGRVQILKSAKEIGKIKEGDILVAPMTTPDFVPAMKRAVAIVTDKGGQTSHAAIVSRELGVPAVVGTETATKTLKTNQMITVSGSTGEIFEGEAKIDKNASKHFEEEKELPVTATKVYVNLGEPDLAPTVASMNVDGVGLLRAEFMMAQIGTHPKKMIRDGKSEQYIKELGRGLEKFCRAFGYRPVVYRASDFKTNEYKNLRGGAEFEQEEANPLIGYRGAFRYVTDEKVFELELAAIKYVRNTLGLKNLWLMIPFCRTVEEMAKVKRIIAASGLARSESFKLWMMVEIPSNVILLEDFAALGIDGISIGSNDLTMLTLGADRDNEALAAVYDERNKASMWMFETAVKKANKLGITSSMCGQAPSTYPEVARKLVEWGVTSMSVSPDVVNRTRRIVAEAEKEIGKK